jgi:hypothetical protein
MLGSDSTQRVEFTLRKSLQNWGINALLNSKLPQVVPLRAQGALSKATLLSA